MTALHVIVEHQNLELLKIFLNHPKIDINVQTI